MKNNELVKRGLAALLCMAFAVSACACSEKEETTKKKKKKKTTTTTTEMTTTEMPTEPPTTTELPTETTELTTTTTSAPILSEDVPYTVNDFEFTLDSKWKVVGDIQSDSVYFSLDGEKNGAMMLTMPGSWELDQPYSFDDFNRDFENFKQAFASNIPTIQWVTVETHYDGLIYYADMFYSFDYASGERYTSYSHLVVSKENEETRCCMFALEYPVSTDMKLIATYFEDYQKAIDSIHFISSNQPDGTQAQEYTIGHVIYSVDSYMYTVEDSETLNYHYFDYDDTSNFIMVENIPIRQNSVKNIDNFKEIADIFGEDYCCNPDFTNASYEVVVCEMRDDLYFALVRITGEYGGYALEVNDCIIFNPKYQELQVFSLVSNRNSDEATKQKMFDAFDRVVANYQWT